MTYIRPKHHKQSIIEAILIFFRHKTLHIAAVRAKVISPTLVNTIGNTHPETVKSCK